MHMHSMQLNREFCTIAGASIAWGTCQAVPQEPGTVRVIAVVQLVGSKPPVLEPGWVVLIDWRVRSVAEVGDGVALKTMDIFAGCGGLSEGMHQARAADTRCYSARCTVVAVTLASARKHTICPALFNRKRVKGILLHPSISLVVASYSCHAPGHTMKPDWSNLALSAAGASLAALPASTRILMSRIP